MLGSLGAMIAFIFILFFAPNVQVLLVGQIMCGKLCSTLMNLATNFS